MNRRFTDTTVKTYIDLQKLSPHTQASPLYKPYEGNQAGNGGTMDYICVGMDDTPSSTLLAWDREVNYHGGALAWSSSVNPSRVTVVEAGLFLATVNVMLEIPSSATQVYLELDVNNADTIYWDGSSLVNYDFRIGSGYGVAPTLGVVCMGVWHLPVGAYFEVICDATGIANVARFEVVQLSRG